MTPEQRAARARLAAHVLHSKVDSREHTRSARAGFMARFEAEVDPTGTLDPEERRRRAEHARRAYMTRLAMRSAKARRKRPATDEERPS